MKHTLKNTALAVLVTSITLGVAPASFAMEGMTDMTVEPEDAVRCYKVTQAVNGGHGVFAAWGEAGPLVQKFFRNPINLQAGFREMVPDTSGGLFAVTSEDHPTITVSAPYLYHVEWRQDLVITYPGKGFITFKVAAQDKPTAAAATDATDR